MTKLTQDDIILLLEDLVTARYKRKDIANDIGVSQQFLSRVMNGRVAPSAKVLDFLGITGRRVSVYEYYRKD